MEYETILSVRLDEDLAAKFATFREKYDLNASEFIRKAIAERMARWQADAASPGANAP